jgi:hypothetical protein
MRDPGMTYVSRESDHRIVDIGAVPLPQLDAFADERMTKIMDTRRGVTAASHPAELGTKLFKDCLHRSFGQSCA